MAKVRHGSFERFYYEKVGLGEGCGCAEHVTRIRDLDAIAKHMASGRDRPGTLSVAVARLRNLALPARWRAVTAFVRKIRKGRRWSMIPKS
jgi:hypothetical protein